MRKNRSCKIVSMCRKQTPITSISLGLLQRNEDFRTPFELANQMISNFLLLDVFFSTNQAFKKNSIIFFKIRKYFTHLYTENLGLRDCVGFLQILSHIMCKSVCLLYDPVVVAAWVSKTIRHHKHEALTTNLKP